MFIQQLQCPMSKVLSPNPEGNIFCVLPAPQRSPQDCEQKSLRGTLCLQIIMINYYDHGRRKSLQENKRTRLKVKAFPYLHQKDVRERLETGPYQPVTGILISDH